MKMIQPPVVPKYEKTKEFEVIKRTRQTIITELQNSRFYNLDLATPPKNYFSKDDIHFDHPKGTLFFEKFLNKI